MNKRILLDKILKTLITLSVFLGSLFIFYIRVFACNYLSVGNPSDPDSYESITDAVENASDGDVVVIFPGEYNESLDIRDKDISLIGLDKSSCIIKCDTSLYSSPVLNGAAGTFANLTFYGYRSKENDITKSNFYDSITPENLDEHFSGYVLHIDDDYESGHSISFINCNIISENNSCIGLGMRDHFSALFSKS